MTATAATPPPWLVSQLLTNWAAHRPEHTAQTWLRFDGAGNQTVNYGELYRQSLAVASALESRALRGSPVLLVHPAGLEFAPAFYGALMAGAIATPVPVPRFASQYQRLENVARDCGPRAVLSTESVLSSLQKRLPADSPLWTIPWLTGFDDNCAPNPDAVPPKAEEIAVLQYTSGSTSKPCGVVVTHGNLAHNLRTITEEFCPTPAAKLLSWLPHFHDMGLIGGVLAPLIWGGEAILMSPQAFLQRPLRWLDAITRFRAEVSGAPNFAYELCLKAAERAQTLPHFDLSSWRIAFVGAEPIRASTLSRFVTRFGASGFRRSALLPCYGLAEATLLVTCKRAGTEYVAHRLSRKFLENKFAQPAGEEPAVDLVGCGYPAKHTEMRIVDPLTGQPLGVRQVGELWVSGPQIAQGYWNDAGSPAFRSCLSREHQFLRTGDLGFITEDGEFVFVERLKDMLVINGQNFACCDLEQTVESSHQSLSNGRAAVVLIESEANSHLVTVVEIPFTQATATVEIAQAIRGALFTSHGLALATVAFIPPGKLSRTTSGKLQRRRTVARIADGSTRVIACSGQPIPEFMHMQESSQSS